MDRKQGLLGGFRGRDEGGEGRGAPSGGGSDPTGGPRRGSSVDAYEEDWYRSLKALAARRAQLADDEDDEAEEGAEPSEASAAAEGSEPPAHEPAAPVAEEPAQEASEPIGEEPLNADEPVADVPTFELIVEEPAPEAEELRDEGGSIGAEAKDEGSVAPDVPVAGDAEPTVEESSGEPDAPDLDVAAEPEAQPHPHEVHEEEAGEEPVAPVVQLRPEAPAPVPAGPSLSARDPAERRAALEQLAAQGPGDGELELVAGMVLDPAQEVRRLALEVLSGAADRVDDGTIRQALQDPADEVRAAAVRIAAQRGARELELLAPLVGARHWPLTQAAALELLPDLFASTWTLGDAELDPLLIAVGEMDSPPEEHERPGIARLSRAVGVSRLVGSLSLPDIRRLGAVRCLVEGEEAPEILRALGTLVSDPIEEIREIAEIAADATARGDRQAAERIEGDEDAPLSPAEAERIASLARSLHDDDEAVRHLARSGLGGVERGRALAWAREAMHTGDVETASAAAESVGVLRLYETAIDLLNRAIELPVEAREPFLTALARVRLDDLLNLLGQVEESRKPEAIRMLWRTSGEQVLPHLRVHLDDPSTAVRMAVLDVMGESGDPSCADIARFVLETDQSPALRAAAVRVLARTNADAASAMSRASGDPDAIVRVAALDELTPALGRAADAYLLQALSDGDEQVRRAAMNQLALREGHDHDFVWSALLECPPEERGELGSVFSKTNPEALTELALQHYGSPEEPERVLAIELAGWSNSQACVEAAIHTLQDPSPAVRAAAAAALGRLRDPSAVRALGNALDDPRTDVRIEAVRALGVIDDEAVLGFLVAALQDGDRGVRTVASEVLTQWSSPAVAKRLAGVLAVPNLRDAATELLRKIGPSSQELLIDVLLHGSAAVKPTVGGLLRDIVGVPALEAKLSAGEADARLRAVEAIGAIGGLEAGDALMGVLSDPDERIRLRATQLLADLGDPRAVQAIIESVLHDPVPEVVAAANDALTRFGVPGAEHAG